MDTRVTSPAWGPPPPCKQALSCRNQVKRPTAKRNQRSGKEAAKKRQRIHSRMFCYDKNILDLENGPDNYRQKNTYSFVESVVMS